MEKLVSRWAHNPKIARSSRVPATETVKNCKWLYSNSNSVNKQLLCIVKLGKRWEFVTMLLNTRIGVLVLITNCCIFQVFYIVGSIPIRVAKYRTNYPVPGWFETSDWLWCMGTGTVIGVRD